MLGNERYPTVDPQRFKQEMKSGYQVRPHDQFGWPSSGGGVVRQDVYLNSYRNSPTNSALPSIDQPHTGYNDRIEPIETPLTDHGNHANVCNVFYFVTLFFQSKIQDKCI